ncbi:MAG: asparagine synthase-related protein [Pseudomonadota bacterium]
MSLDLKSNQVSSARYNSISLSHNQAQKAKSDIFEGTSTLEKILLSSLTNIDKDFKLGIPLSGGLDSRAIVYQSYQKFKFETLTYGQEHSFEFSNADAVAKALDLVNHKYILDNKHYLNTHIESCVYSGGISHLMHSHLSSAIASNSFKGVVIGFMGDPIAGSAQHINFQGKGFEDFADALLKYRKIGLKDLKNIFSTSDEAEIVEDLRDLYIDIKDLCPHERLLEYYFIVIRQSKLISSIFNSILSQKIQIFYPFMDDRFARFFLELGYDDRLNRKFYKECIREMESKFFSNFGLDIAFPKTRLYGMNAKAARTCQSLVELISMGKFSLSNPFLTENPNSVLNNCLKNIYSESLSVCEANGIINQELAKKIQGPFLTTAWTHSAFRIISIKKMIDYFSI